MTSPIDLAIEKLRKHAEEATPGPWWLATGNSWRRIRASTREGDLPVIEPTTHPGDGWPDLHDYAKGANLAWVTLMDPRVGAAVADLASQLWAGEGYCAACEWHEEYGPHPKDCPLARLAALLTEDTP